MNSMNYKVIFKGTSEDLKKKPSLTFKRIENTTPINVSSQIIIELKKLSELNPSILSFQNIEEVIKIGKDSDTNTYNYYFVLLYHDKNENQREGLLIGNLKKQGDIVIGIWPFNNNVDEIPSEEILNVLNNLVKKPSEFGNICLIN